MATVGVVDVKDLTVYVGGVAVGCATDASLEVSQGVREILCKDTSGWKESKSGIKEWSMSASGLMAFDAPAGGGAYDLIDILIAGTEVILKFGTEDTADKSFNGTAQISSVSISSSGGGGENVTYSVSFVGSGAPSILPA